MKKNFIFSFLKKFSLNNFFVSNRIIICFSAVASFAIVISIRGICSEWLPGEMDAEGARNSIVARQFVESFRIPPSLQPDTSLHGFIYILSGVFALFGSTEFAARCLAVFMNIISLLAFLWVFMRCGSLILSIVGGFLFVLIPAYMKFSNLPSTEVLCLFAIAGTIFSLELYLSGKKEEISIPLFCFFVLLGAFSDVHYYIFAIFLLCLMPLLQYSKQKKEIYVKSSDSKSVVKLIFVSATFACLVIVSAMIAHFISSKVEISEIIRTGIFRWLDSGNFQYGLERLLEVSGGLDSLLLPIVILGAVFWFVDMVCRSFIMKVSRFDGYLFLIFLSWVIPFFLLLEDNSFIEKGLVFLSVFVAFSSPMGLWRISEIFSHGSRKVKWAFSGVAFILLFYQIADNTFNHFLFADDSFVSENESSEDKNYFKLKESYHSQISLNRLASFLSQKMNSGERLAIHEGISLTPQFDYYLNRSKKFFRSRTEIAAIMESKNFPFLLLKQDSVWSDVLSFLIEKFKFVYLDGYYVFDLSGKRIKKTELLKKGKLNLSFWQKYLQYPACLRWCMIGSDAVSGLDKEIMLYNEKIAKGGEAKIERVIKELNYPAGRRIVFASILEYLGASIRKEEYGRVSIKLLFRALTTPDINVEAKLDIAPVSLSSKFQKWWVKSRPVIPSMMWEPDYLYTIETESPSFNYPVNIDFSLSWFDSFQIFDIKKSDNKFQVACPVWKDDPLSAIAVVSTKLKDVEELKQALLVIKQLPYKNVLKGMNLGEKIFFHGCLSAPYGDGRWVSRFFFQNLGVDEHDTKLKIIKGGEHPSETVTAIGKMSGEKGKGRVFWVEAYFDDDPSKEPLYLEFGVERIPEILKGDDGEERISIIEGGMLNL